MQPQPHDHDEAIARRTAFVNAIPSELTQAEDELPKVVRALNASVRSKLQRIYQVADALSQHREPFVACRKGCAACCQMNVAITAVEAERLARASGRRATSLAATITHDQGAFAGTPCPFLDEHGSCSVYQDRPLSCRKHASYFTTDIACRPPAMHQIDVPMLSFSGLDEALFALSNDNDSLVLGDIRDFFPDQRSPA